MVSPCYATLHWDNGSVAWQGYYPGNIDLCDACNGGGSGILGTGACGGSIVMDWWFSYVAPQNRNRGHTRAGDRGRP